MIVLPLLVVLAIVGVVYATTHRHAHAHVAATGSEHIDAARSAPMSQVGRSSLVVLAAGLVLWAFTFSALPIYYVAALGGVSLVLAIIAVTRSRDRSPMLLVPLLFVPLAAVLTIAFVVLS